MQHENLLHTADGHLSQTVLGLSTSWGSPALQQVVEEKKIKCACRVVHTEAVSWAALQPMLPLMPLRRMVCLQMQQREEYSWSRYTAELSHFS